MPGELGHAMAHLVLNFSFRACRNAERLQLISFPRHEGRSLLSELSLSAATLASLSTSSFPAVWFLRDPLTICH